MLSFSFSKKAAPKKDVPVQQETESKHVMREVEQVSEVSGIETRQEDVSTLNIGDSELVIPCRTIYLKEEKKSLKDNVPLRADLRKSESRPGIIYGESGNELLTSASEFGHVGNVPRKRPTSILMQIRAARMRGDISDAPDQVRRGLDPEKFGWAILKGMGYDPSSEEAQDLTKSLRGGNRAKLGIGMKIESMTLPHEQSKIENDNS